MPTVNQTVSTLRFFFRVTLKRHEIVEHAHVIHEPRKLPVVPSVEEVARLALHPPPTSHGGVYEIVRQSALSRNIFGSGRS